MTMKLRHAFFSQAERRAVLFQCVLSLLVAMSFAGDVLAGPPYVSDDPEPTDYKQYEIYLFSSATHGREDTNGASGIDLNYGASKDLQLTAVLPIAWDHSEDGRTTTDLGNIELAAKYRFLHKDEVGWDVAVFPRLFLPSASARVGEKHFSLLLPIWLQKDWDKWSTFGGGGCEINRGGDSQNFCLAGWAITHQALPNLQIGAELVHQTADTKDGKSTTRLGAGLRYDISDHYHLLASAGPGLENVAETGRYSWYVSVLLTL